jgi:hypothetical protein
MPKMEIRHDRTENCKRDICAYTYRNPATFNQIKTATELSRSYLRYLMNQLNADRRFEITTEFDRDSSKYVNRYRSLSEYNPKGYVRDFSKLCPNKVLTDELISIALEKLATQPVKVVAIDLSINIGTVYWIKKRYGGFKKFSPSLPLNEYPDNSNDEWDEARIDIIGANGDGYPDKSHYET